MPQPVMPVLGPTPVPFEQRIMMDKMTIHSAVTLPQRIQRTPMPGDPPEQPQPGAPGMPQPGAGAQPQNGMPGQPPPQQQGLSPSAAPPGSAQFGLPPTDPQGMLQQLQSRYSQQPQPTG